MTNTSHGSVRAIRTTEELLAYSLAMETEAVERFNDLAEQMEIHHNYDVADLFRKLARIEGLHIDNVKRASAGKQLPDLLAWEYEWEGGQSPEGGAMEDAHYLMQPWHAIELAMQGEKRALAFFRNVAATADDEALRKMALELADEEEEHVTLLQQWQERFPKPDKGWDVDLDPPAMLE
ncbi:MAG TPA: ferritin family protein [Xanthomonadales bacterium]